MRNKSAGRPRSRDERVVLIAHPSADVYGADLQMLESVSGLVESGWRAVVVCPGDGPLITHLRDRRAEVVQLSFPVLRRESVSPSGLVRLVVSLFPAMFRMIRLILIVKPQVLYINTVTIPWWLLAGRLTGRPVVCHVHEAETDDRRAVRLALYVPLLLAQKLIVISRASLEAVVETVGHLRARCNLVYNGVPEPPPGTPIEPPQLGDLPLKLVVVARLSPRKGVDVALEAVAALRREGREVELSLCGTPFAGYEWYEKQLRSRAAEPDLKGSVRFLGYVRPIWSELLRADFVLAPSLREPFGNTVVEAQLVARPVIAAGSMGHLETIEDGVTGILVAAGDPEAMARAIATLAEDPEQTRAIADRGLLNARERFSTARYRMEIAALFAELGS